MIHFNWKKHFAHQIQSFELFDTDTPNLVSLLEKQIIESKEYLIQFQNECLLPILRDDFFDSYSGQNSLFLSEKYPNLSLSWSPLCVPIGEWDGSLIVAGCCFETIPADESVILVLANFEKTQGLWQFLKTSETSPSIELPLHEQNEIEFFSNENDLEDTKKFNLDSLDVANETVPIDKPLINIHSDPLIPLVELRDDIQTIPEVPLLNENEDAQNSNDESLQSNELLEGLEINLQSAPMGLADPQAQVENKNFWKNSASSDDLEEITNIGYKIESTSWDQVRPVWSEVQDELATFFDSSILVSINSDLETFKTVLWSANLHSKKPETSFQLNSPSIFRVVYTTFKPYHGYVVSNEINEAFFSVWNNNETPSHVSIAPIIIDQNMKAFLIGIGNVNSFTKNSLFMIEKMAEKISEILKQSLEIKKTEVA